MGWTSRSCCLFHNMKLSNQKATVTAADTNMPPLSWSSIAKWVSRIPPFLLCNSVPSESPSEWWNLSYTPGTLLLRETGEGNVINAIASFTDWEAQQNGMGRILNESIQRIFTLFVFYLVYFHMIIRALQTLLNPSQWLLTLLARKMDYTEIQ